MNDARHNAAASELLSLAAGYCHGTLSPEEFARLERLLLGDAAARALFRRYLGLDAALHDHGQSAAPSWTSSVHPQPRKTPVRMVGAATIAVLAIAVVLGVVFSPRPAHSTAIAALERVTGDVRILGSDGQVRSIAANASLCQGDTVRTRGNESSTVVAYADGTRLTLVGNTSVTCGDPRSKSIVVHQGTLAGSVRPQAQETPMLLATPSVQVQVLGTRFQIEAVANRTDLSVTEGRVRVVRTSDGQAVDVADGKHAVITEQNKLLVQDLPGVSDTWEVDFEPRLPEGWDEGERVTEGLPAGSRGAVKAVLDESEDNGGFHRISSQESWLRGLFVIRKTSHLHLTFKIDNPKWMNVLLVTRTSDPHEPHFSGNYLFRDFPSLTPGRWQTLSIPLAQFQRIHAGDVPVEDVVPYKLTFFSDGKDRGLVIDRIWVTPDGPGEVVLKTLD